MSNICYIDQLPEEILHMIYNKSLKIEWNTYNQHGYRYSRIYDCSRYHRQFRKKSIYLYDYSTRDWIFWNTLI
jgi:hypothetical protein